MGFRIPSLNNLYEEFHRECNSRHGVTDNTRSVRGESHQHKDKDQGALIHSSETNCDRIDDERVTSSANGVCSRDNGVRRGITLHIPENRMLQDPSRVVGSVTGVLPPPPGIINTPLHTPSLRSSSAAIANQDKKSYPPPPPPLERRRSAHDRAISGHTKIDSNTKPVSSSSVTSAPASTYPLKSHTTPPGVVTQVTNDVASASSLSGRWTKPNIAHTLPPPRESPKQCKSTPPPRIKKHDIGQPATQLVLNATSFKSHRIPIPREVYMDRNNTQEFTKTQVYPPPPKPKESQPTRIKGRAVNTPLASTRAHPQVKDSTSTTKSKITHPEDNNNISTTHSDKRANMSIPSEAARRDKLRFRKGQVKSSAEDNNKSSVALSNEKSVSVPPEAAADITSAAKSKITNQEDNNNISATHSDKRANISFLSEASRRDKLRFRKGQVRSPAEENDTSSVALSNEKSVSVPPEATADIARAAKSKITNQEDNNNGGGTRSDECANISVPPEASRRDKLRFRKGQVRSSAEDNNKSTVADSIPSEVAADISSAAKSKITHQEDNNNGSATHSDKRANISVPLEASRREKLRFRKGQVRSPAEKNDTSSVALSNEKSDLIPSEATATRSRRDKLGAHVGHSYTLGETLRSPSHATIAAGRTPKRASEVVGRSLADNDCAFVKCADGSFSYAILACRSEEYDPGNRSLEECMMFVLSNSGQTKTIKKSQWGTCIRLLSKDDGPKDAPVECAKDSGMALEQDKALQQDHRLEDGTISCGEVHPSRVAADAEVDDLVSCISSPGAFSNVNEHAEKTKHEYASSQRATFGAFTEDPDLHFC